MHTQRDVTAPRGIIVMAGGMFGFIAPTIVMDIAIMSTCGESSADILQAAAQTAVAGTGSIGSTTVGICERRTPPAGPQIRNPHHPPALNMQADNNKK
jgi:predicted ABC-type sugar transport system permease subunit